MLSAIKIMMMCVSLQGFCSTSVQKDTFLKLDAEIFFVRCQAREAFAELERTPGRLAEDVAEDLQGTDGFGDAFFIKKTMSHHVDEAIKRVSTIFVGNLLQDADVKARLESMFPYLCGDFCGQEVLARMKNNETFLAEVEHWSCMRKQRRSAVLAFAEDISKALVYPSVAEKDSACNPRLLNAAKLILNEPELQVFLRCHEGILGAKERAFNIKSGKLRMFNCERYASNWFENLQYVVLKLLDYGMHTFLPNNALNPRNFFVRKKAASEGKKMLDSLSMR